MINEKLKSAGAGLIGLAVVALLLFLVGLVLHGVAWVSDKLFPWFSFASLIAFSVEVVVLLPLSAIRKSRAFASVAIACCSYLFGATVWMQGLLTTLALWGGVGVMIGLFLAGIGIVPIGILAALFHGMWYLALRLVLLTFLTFGSRLYATWLLDRRDEPRHVETLYALEDVTDAVPQQTAELSIGAPQSANTSNVRKYRYCLVCRVRVGAGDSVCNRCGATLG